MGEDAAREVESNTPATEKLLVEPISGSISEASEKEESA